MKDGKPTLMRIGERQSSAHQALSAYLVESQYFVTFLLESNIALQKMTKTRENLISRVGKWIVQQA